MKIFLTYLVLNTAQGTGYNYGLAYIAAVLLKAGYNVSYFILTDKQDILEFYEKINSEKPEIIAFSATTSQYNNLKYISKKIKEILPKSFIVCGGVHPTLKPECIVEVPELDAIARGEGEYSLLELVKAIEDQRDYTKIRNFWFREENIIIKNEIRPLIRYLDELPFPDKSSLNYQQVIDRSEGVNRFIFSRGCPFECTYCCNRALSEIYPNKGSYFRQRSPEKAIEEIEIDSKKYKFESIVFDNDTMSLDKKWFYEFFSLYKKEFNYPFRCNLRVGTVDSDMIRLLKEAGAKNIGIGIEHGNEEFRKKVLKRRMSNKQIIDTFKLCNQYNITHSDFIMVGFPFENKKLFLDTVKLCREVSAHGSISIFYPYPNTELGKICEENNWLPDKEFYREREEALISYPNFSKEEIQLCADTFSLLMRFPFIPLNIPLKWILYAYKFSRFMDSHNFLKFIKEILFFFPRKLTISKFK